MIRGPEMRLIQFLTRQEFRVVKYFKHLKWFVARKKHFQVLEMVRGPEMWLIQVLTHQEFRVVKYFKHLK